MFYKWVQGAKAPCRGAVGGVPPPPVGMGKIFEKPWGIGDIDAKGGGEMCYNQSDREGP